MSRERGLGYPIVCYHSEIRAPHRHQPFTPLPWVQHPEVGGTVMAPDSTAGASLLPPHPGREWDPPPLTHFPQEQPAPRGVSRAWGAIPRSSGGCAAWDHPGSASMVHPEHHNRNSLGIKGFSLVCRPHKPDPKLCSANTQQQDSSAFLGHVPLISAVVIPIPAVLPAHGMVLGMFLSSLCALGPLMQVQGEQIHKPRGQVGTFLLLGTLVDSFPTQDPQHCLSAIQTKATWFDLSQREWT